MKVQVRAQDLKKVLDGNIIDAIDARENNSVCIITSKGRMFNYIKIPAKVIEKGFVYINSSDTDKLYRFILNLPKNDTVFFEFEINPEKDIELLKFFSKNTSLKRNISVSYVVLTEAELKTEKKKPDFEFFLDTQTLLKALKVIDFLVDKGTICELEGIYKEKYTKFYKPINSQYMVVIYNTTLSNTKGPLLYYHKIPIIGEGNFNINLSYAAIEELIRLLKHSQINQLKLNYYKGQEGRRLPVLIFEFEPNKQLEINLFFDEVDEQGNKIFFINRYCKLWNNITALQKRSIFDYPDLNLDKYYSLTFETKEIKKFSDDSSVFSVRMINNEIRLKRKTKEKVIINKSENYGSIGTKFGIDNYKLQNILSISKDKNLTFFKSRNNHSLPIFVSSNPEEYMIAVDNVFGIHYFPADEIKEEDVLVNPSI